ncbi:SAV_6107 family HEPN domain-containing protein [Amycolatopsis sp. CA-128772]|uniref:SAV_6107 family HEPN domain-containing protein n=1 Tax=Amycolatopsis sp. CA-128772 TaxID=2073159 RepID=UPI000CD2453E|nr:SAV_6107 family HEPN domain-containing protein [Amycolatopsis sp. CA-128772]
MSVKVVSPTDPGQPELPMTLRPQATRPQAPRRSRQCLTPAADSRPRPSAEMRQPELPMVCAAGAVSADPGQRELPPVAAASEQSEDSAQQPELPVPPQRPAALERSRPAEDSAHQSELPAPPQRPAAREHSQPPAVDSGLSASLRPPGADQSSLPMALRPPAHPAAAGLLAQARRLLAEAERETQPAERFIGAYLAALRGAAAVLAARGRPHRGRARPASTWVLLDSVAPELREWSAFFASNSATRAAAQAGITGKVTAGSAAELVGAATPFLELVRRLVHGLPITGEAHVA